MEGLETPVGPYTGWVLGERVGLAPILRAGMQMTERESIGHPHPLPSRSCPITSQRRGLGTIMYQRAVDITFISVAVPLPAVRPF